MGKLTGNNFSLMFLMGFLLKQLPMPLLQFFLTFALKRMKNLHPRVFQKVGENLEHTFLIVPTDLPFNFYLVVNEFNPSLTLVDKNEETEAAAVIKSNLNNLLEMFEGSLDGDAAFFSKHLVIEGSTAAIVSLRNAIDGEDIDIISDLTSNLGIFSRVIKKFLASGVSRYQKINDSLSLLQETLLKEYEAKTEYNSKQIELLKSELANLRSNLLNKE